MIVFIENKPGSLAELASVLAEAGININHILLEGSVDFGAARLHVDTPRKAEKALKAAGFQVASGEAITVRVKNSPGQLADVAGKLSRAKVNIESIFGTAADGEVEFVVLVNDVERARKALGIKS